jgi:cytochrome c peroxidase
VLARAPAAFGLAFAFTAMSAFAAPGGIIENGQATQPTYVNPGDEAAAGVNQSPATLFMVPGFLFEPEVPLSSLKGAPTWNEVEQLLDNPYAVTTGCTDAQGLIPGNDQGFPTYCSTIARRSAFGVTLPPLVVHPLNYNPTSGEEMRMLNSEYAGGEFDVPDQVWACDGGADLPADVATACGAVTDGSQWVWSYKTVTVSGGADRVLEPAIDYNSPIDTDLFAGIVCVTNVELVPPEGTILCGGDPGEPGDPMFGLLDADAYSTPAVPGSTKDSTIGLPLHDSLRGDILARDVTTGAGGLMKPSLRIPENGGTPDNPNYMANTDPDDVVASNENDYVRDRDAAIVLGKALFWDMQVGSDGVQACGSCHFAAGVDDRAKNQLNPNHLGGDLAFQLHPPNGVLVRADFPFHKLTNPEIAGDPKCGPSNPQNPGSVGILRASVNAGVLDNNPNGVNNVTVCNRANIRSDVNDVASSMGVHFGLFADIPAIATFVTNASGVNVVPPDLRSPTAADNIDPIPGFAGPLANPTVANFGHRFRRVEPRNTPTIFAADFNFDNFWDGRARHDFNGGSVFGASDPQTHVFVDQDNTLTATRQIIKFSSLASLATGPGLSEFEMSFQGRNWAKIGKKLLQAGATPLANQLVATDDSVLGPYSNQGGSACAGLAPEDRSPGTPAAGKPGLCVSYPGLIRLAFYPALWQNSAQHLDGCYTDGKPALHPNQCAAGAVAIPVLDSTGAVVDSTADPFDGYVLSIADSAAVATETDEFTQMEANMSLFFGLGIHLWATILVPDDTPYDQFLDANPDAFAALGEPGERGLVEDLLNCTTAGQRNAPTAANPIGACFTPVGHFKRDPVLTAFVNCTVEGGTGCDEVQVTGGTRGPNDPDPLLGLDIFHASNLSLKNANFRTARCGECHASPTLTDHTMPFTFKAQLRDFASEFPPGQPGVEALIEPLGRNRVISGFLLESELNETGQDGVERRMINQSIVPNPSDGLAYPDGIFNPNGTAVGNDGLLLASSVPGDSRYAGAGQAFFDNGVYNLGVRPIGEDVGRGGPDPFGWPLSLAALMFKDLAGSVDGPAFEPGVPLPNFDPDLGPTGGLFEESAQDQQINPGFETDDIVDPGLPPYLAPFANHLNVGDSQPELDEIFGAVNTLTDVPILEGFLDSLGPINPGARLNEAHNNGETAIMGTWPNVNRVGRMGSFKAPQLRNVELTGPYFHNGGLLTLRQVVDFYVRGGDFPITNAAHRDFNLVNMNVEVQSNLTEAEKVALVDYLLELTDERVAYERAPFDRPEMFIPLDGTAPDNTFGRPGFLARLTGTSCDGLPGSTGPCFRQVPVVGAAGHAARLPAFLGLSNQRLVGNAASGPPSCPQNGQNAGATSQYCH